MMKVSEIKEEMVKLFAARHTFRGSTYSMSTFHIENLKLETLLNINDNLADISKQLKLMVKQWDETE